MSKIYDILEKTLAFWTAQLTTANTVVSSSLDERVDSLTPSAYPRIVIGVEDMETDQSRRQGGVKYKRTFNPGTNTWSYEKLGIPVNFRFQVDIIAAKKSECFTLEEGMMVVLGQRYPFITLDSGEKIFLHLEGVAMRGLEQTDNTFRTTFSYYLQTWLEDLTIIPDDYAVLTLNINYVKDDDIKATVEVT